MIPIVMVDLKRQYEKIKPEVNAAIQEVIDNTAFINGKAVSDFQKDLEQFLKVKHVIPCANGTDALQIAMMGLGFKAGDEVITVSHTYIATVEVMALLGLTPVFIDVNAETFNIDIHQIEAQITDKTVAIAPVHLYGQCADMEPLLALAKKHNLKVIEDTAQAIGAEYTFSNGTVKKAGTMGDIGTTSFFPSKNLGCYGDGGAIFTNNDELAANMRMIANHGQKVRYYHEVIGVNSRLDSIQAAILKIKLKHLNDYAAARNRVAAAYDAAFAEVPQLTIPVRAGNSTHVFHQYTLNTSGINRDEFKTYLEENGVPCMIYYPVPVHQQNGLKNHGFKSGNLSVTEALMNTLISLPIHTELDDEQLQHIINTVKAYFA